MADDTENLIVPFLGALQASVAVLLTIFAGVIASQFNLLSEPASKEVSKICVRLFMPALLIVNVGSQISLDSGLKYVPIVVWAIAYNVISMLAGFALTKLFGMPDWATPAIAFNNTTSLPLLLVQSLETTGILAAIDNSGDAVNRAKSYFLLNSMIGNTLTFALGPRLLNGHEEDAPHEWKDEDGHEDNTDDQDGNIEAQEEESEQVNERTSLLPNRITRDWTRAEYRGYRTGKRYWKELPPWGRHVLIFLYSFLNPATIGAVIGILLGLVPPLHRLFFNDQYHGGYLNGWLTSATQNIGDLFASLQVVVVGVKLSNALVRMKNGEASGRVPWLPMILITLIRFVIWPAISIPIIYVLASKTNLLSNDPIVWFTMMLMPVGPPALKLTALADVNGADDDERMSIAKFLTVSYFISPLICFAVVGSLKASQAALGS